MFRLFGILVIGLAVSILSTEKTWAEVAVAPVNNSGLDWNFNPPKAEEAKHGMFSYFLMKGMEGEADANKNNEITAGELHSYVQTNVIQQSSGSQTPELQGDADRVLVRFK